MRLPLNEWFFGNVKAVEFPHESILFWEDWSPLENVFGSRVISTINEGMVEGSVDLWSVLVELFFVVFVEVVEVDGFGAEDEVIEGGDANILFHEITILKNKFLGVT